MILPRKIIDEICTYLPFEKALYLSTYAAHKLYNSRIHEHTWEYAAETGNFKMLRYMHHRRLGKVTFAVSESLADNGHLEMYKWLYVRNVICTRPYDIGVAAQSGHLNMVKWLYEKNNGKVSCEIIEGPFINGHLKVAKWLHIRHDNCLCILESSVIHGIVKEESLNVVKWMVPKYPETLDIFIYAAKVYKNKIILEWLNLFTKL